MAYRGYEPVIGLEIHVQLNTQSKIFSVDSTHFGGSDNENTSPVSLGLPGALPVLNEKAVEYAIKTGLALNCKIRKKSVFARKNYFYPDLAKGYQISQHDEPICEHGYLEIETSRGPKRINIVRAHLEEDAGKSTHHGEFTLINYNRAGIPLLEVVSAPELETAEEAAEYARSLRQVVRYLGVCDGNLEEGSLRCDVNVSVKKQGASTLGTRVEIKNINSFRFIEKAVEYEIDRQIDRLEQGDKVLQETRLWDADKNRTFSMRTKEDAEDYRYFPDPDLLPLIVDDHMIEKIQRTLPELPRVRAQRFVAQLGLSQNDAKILTAERELGDYFEQVAKLSGNEKASANWILTEVLREINANNILFSELPLSPLNLARLIQLVDKQVISGKIAKTVFSEIWEKDLNPDELVQKKGLGQITDNSVVNQAIEKVLDANPSQVAEYRSGKEKVFGFFVGAVMKETKGQASPDLVNKILREKLKG
ncbi:MAG: Asp-tRNA(Asn)/Glu-tRNA(Gln) amidotransferase subunit GatB [Bdellovibrionia bacterium]